MYWRSEKEIIEEFTGVFRRIFTYVNQLSNKDKELLTLPTGSLSNAIYETYAEQPETYPQIQVTSGGISFTDSLNNLISIISEEEEFLGIRGTESVRVSKNFPLKIKIPSHLTGISARGFLMPFASIDYEGGENVDIKLYKNYTTSPSLEATGSMLGNPSTAYLSNFAELSQEVTFTNEDWWLEITPQEDSKYLFGIDKSINSSYIYFDNNENEVQETGSLHSSVLSPVFIRVGGQLEGSILIKCSDKDNSQGARNIASTVSLFCNLLKQAQVSRKNEVTIKDKTQLVFAQATDYDEWLEKGIRIKKIRQNPIVDRRRSSNEIIFESTVVVDIVTEWFQDYPVTTLNEIDVNIKNILPPDFRVINVIVKD